jgi:hypothetical protein
MASEGVTDLRVLTNAAVDDGRVPALKPHPSGTPAMRKPTEMRSRPARKVGLSLDE